MFSGVPSPKSHDQDMIEAALGTDRSVKVVGFPWQTESAVKSATGSRLTVTVFWMVSSQLFVFVTVRRTV